MRPFWKKMLSCAMAFVCLTGAAAGLTGCHGSKEKAAFEVPESFDTTKQYEITFWAKNDTNIRQTDIYKKTIADFESTLLRILRRRRRRMSASPTRIILQRI